MIHLAKVIVGEFRSAEFLSLLDIPLVLEVILCRSDFSSKFTNLLAQAIFFLFSLLQKILKTIFV